MNKVLLALIFIALQNIGFAQNHNDFPNWFYNLPQSNDSVVFSIGISDENMNEIDAHDLAEKRSQILCDLLFETTVKLNAKISSNSGFSENTVKVIIASKSYSNTIFSIEKEYSNGKETFVLGKLKKTNLLTNKQILRTDIKLLQKDETNKNTNKEDYNLTYNISTIKLDDFDNDIEIYSEIISKSNQLIKVSTNSGKYKKDVKYSDDNETSVWYNYFNAFVRSYISTDYKCKVSKYSKYGEKVDRISCLSTVSRKINSIYLETDNNYKEKLNLNIEIVKISNLENVQRYVIRNIEQWQIREKFENTDEYITRVNNDSRIERISQLTEKKINELANIQYKGLKISQKDYDADSEVFKLTLNDSLDIYINVPVANNEAKEFYNNITKLQFSEQVYYLTNNDEFELKSVSIKNPKSGKEYNYDWSKKIVFRDETPTNSFALNSNLLTSLSAHDANVIKTTNSDVDINIPKIETKNDKTFVVIIGNENYEHDIKVDYAKKDASTFQEYAIKTLGVPEKQVHYIENATHGNFEHELEWLNNITKAHKGNAKIIFYYAGHGMPDQSTKDAFLLPTDGYSSSTKTAIKLQYIYSKLSEYPSSQVIVFLDACFSGDSRDGMLTSGRGVRIVPKEQSVKGNMVVFSASSGNETAHPYIEKQHGLFTYFLLKKLQETNGDVSFGELDEYISSNVIKESLILQKEQNPTVKANRDLNGSWKNWTFSKKE